MSDTATFQIVYAGSALENNEMEIRELAPALVAVADLLEETNLIINGGGTKVSVNVRGSFKSGSFGIDFIIIQSIYQVMMGLLNSDGVTAANNLLGLLGLKDVGKGLIGLLKKLKNRKIKKIERIDNSKMIIHITHDEKIEIDPRIIELYKSSRVRDALERVIAKPLERSGIEEFKIKVPGVDIPVSVSKDEREYFELPLLDDELLGEYETEAYVQIVSLSFKEDNKWRFARGDSVFHALVLDKDFLARVSRNEVVFSKDDILRVRLLTKDILADKMRTEHTVLEVLEHRNAARQLRLPFENDDHDDDSHDD